jgi:hypothetical protein
MDPYETVWNYDLPFKDPWIFLTFLHPYGDRMVSPSGERAKVWRASTISSQFLQPPGAKWASWASGTHPKPKSELDDLEVRIWYG